MYDLFDETQENGYDYGCFECLPEDDEKYWDGE